MALGLQREKVKKKKKKEKEKKNVVLLHRRNGLVLKLSFDMIPVDCRNPTEP